MVKKLTKKEESKWLTPRTVKINITSMLSMTLVFLLQLWAIIWVIQKIIGLF